MIAMTTCTRVNVSKTTYLCMFINSYECGSRFGKTSKFAFCLTDNRTDLGARTNRNQLQIYINEEKNTKETLVIVLKDRLFVQSRFKSNRVRHIVDSKFVHHGYYAIITTIHSNMSSKLTVITN